QGVGNLIMALMLSRWVQYCRVVRGEVLSLKERDFVTAAKALGAKDWYVIFRHVVPNTFASVTVIATFGMAIVIITEASLSFLGLGVPVHIPTWGSMLSEGRSYINRAPWLTIFPGLAIFITVFGINLLGDGLRDIFDPKLRRQRLRSAQAASRDRVTIYHSSVADSIHPYDHSSSPIYGEWQHVIEPLVEYDGG